MGKPLIKDPAEHLRVCFKFRVLRPDTIAMGISSDHLQMLQGYLKENFTVSRQAAYVPNMLTGAFNSDA